MFDRVGFFRVITPCRGIRDHRRPGSVEARPIYFRRRWKLATTYTRVAPLPSSLRPFPRAELFRPRVKGDLSKSAHLSRYIFKMETINPVPVRVYKTHGIACRVENLSLRQKPKVNVPRPPKNTRGASSSVAGPSHHFRRLSRVFEESFISGWMIPLCARGRWTLDILLMQENGSNESSSAFSLYG